ncbi:hypothetical protein KAU19_03125 [Candidatus Parcubacteria bacterium]|nr:hypothetical protein [Candidatus Parcubacteria bacterium]
MIRFFVFGANHVRCALSNGVNIIRLAVLLNI